MRAVLYCAWLFCSIVHAEIADRINVKIFKDGHQEKETFARIALHTGYGYVCAEPNLRNRPLIGTRQWVGRCEQFDCMIMEDGWLTKQIKDQESLIEKLMEMVQTQDQRIQQLESIIGISGCDE